ncbi:hypothetical protein [Streptomyces sp. ALI-76-A]|uniref:hypothetical protein n=1 Tax=Streptomyces sp. ALI-76-A TaxID=3025736 RepID=UPI00256F2520|nr:hypothetical protein [Streptomyces sp. ALI-76-A]MDL5200296.1 hypothetical protein [Streptomyces sp. ALI-76-A]
MGLDTAPLELAEQSAQVPLARFGTTSAAARALLAPLAAAFAVGGLAMAFSATGGPVTASLLLTAAAVAFTLAEMLHTTVSWEFSVALAPATSLGGYLGVHGIVQSAQRGIGPLAVTAAMATGPIGWPAFGTDIALTCMIRRRLVRDRMTRTPLSVPPITVSEH